jgi:hypothetical protein
MAPQTPTQRQASTKRAAATRKRNATKETASTTRASARRAGRAASSTTRSARATAQAAGSTAAHATETTARGVEAATTQLGAVGRQAQRVLLIPIGALATAGDTIKRTAQTYGDAGRRARQLDRFELRGARTLAFGRSKVLRRAP